jgi:transposase InsO family protein
MLHRPVERTRLSDLAENPSCFAHPPTVGMSSKPFHWQVADKGMEHVYIKARTPQLNGKVERSHRIDKDELYQLS